MSLGANDTLDSSACYGVYHRTWISMICVRVQVLQASATYDPRPHYHCSIQFIISVFWVPTVYIVLARGFKDASIFFKFAVGHKHLGSLTIIRATDHHDALYYLPTASAPAPVPSAYPPNKLSHAQKVSPAHAATLPVRQTPSYYDHWHTSAAVVRW